MMPSGRWMAATARGCDHRLDGLRPAPVHELGAYAAVAHLGDDLGQLGLFGLVDRDHQGTDAAVRHVKAVAEVLPAAVGAV